MKQLKVWTNDKEEFISMINDGEWCVTKDLQFVEDTRDKTGDFLDNEGKPIDDDDVIDSFSIGDTYHTTSRLRDYCDEFHPDIDFDTKFETQKPGVFARYEDKFGHDYTDWVQEQIYSELCEALKERGYSLPF